MFCNACGTRVGGSDRHCPNCGRGLKSRGPGTSQTTPKESSAPQSLSPSSAQIPLVRQPPRETKSPDKPSNKSPDKPSVKPKAKSSGRGSNAPSGEATGSGASPAESSGAGLGDIRGLLWERPAELEPGLTVYKDAKSKPVGIRYESEVGEIDLLARDDSGGLVVVMVADETVKGGKELVSDALERIGWVRLQVAESGQEVRAVVLTGAVPDDLSYAAAAVSGTVAFKTYRVAVTFEDVIV